MEGDSQRGEGRTSDATRGVIADRTRDAKNECSDKARAGTRKPSTNRAALAQHTYGVKEERHRGNSGALDSHKARGERGKDSRPRNRVSADGVEEVSPQEVNRPRAAAASRNSRAFQQ